MVAVVSAVGLVLSGVLVELVKARRRQETVVSAVTPNHGSSMADAVRRIETDIRELRGETTRHGQRLAGLEALLGRGRGR